MRGLIGGIFPFRFVDIGSSLANGRSGNGSAQLTSGVTLVSLSVGSFSNLLLRLRDCFRGALKLK